jgi:hypothetical protein
LTGYRRLLDGFPPGAVVLQLCTVTERGLTVFDTCPSCEAFHEFVSGAMFSESVAAAGLPRPRIEPVGELHHTVVGESVSRRRRARSGPRRRLPLSMRQGRPS